MALYGMALALDLYDGASCTVFLNGIFTAELIHMWTVLQPTIKPERVSQSKKSQMFSARRFWPKEHSERSNFYSTSEDTATYVPIGKLSAQVVNYAIDHLLV